MRCLRTDGGLLFDRSGEGDRHGGNEEESDRVFHLWHQRVRLSMWLGIVELTIELWSLGRFLATDTVPYGKVHKLRKGTKVGTLHKSII